MNQSAWERKFRRLLGEYVYAKSHRIWWLFFVGDAVVKFFFGHTAILTEAG